MQDRSEELQLTVLNQRRVNPFLNSGGIDRDKSSRIKKEHPIAEKICGRDTSYNMRWVSYREVTQKIGSVDSRDFSTRQPLLKIGQTYANNFVNTYQIA
jgi:hypothetical protein